MIAQIEKAMSFDTDFLMHKLKAFARVKSKSKERMQNVFLHYLFYCYTVNSALNIFVVNLPLRLWNIFISSFLLTRNQL